MNEFYADKMAVTGDVRPEVKVVKFFFGLVGEEGYSHRLLLTNERAKELYLILGKVLKAREAATGQLITLTEEFYRHAGIAPEDY